jgi:transposase
MTDKKSNKKYFIGVDLHSNQLTCCFLDSNNSRKYVKFPVDANGIQNFIEMAGKDSYVSVEASTGTFEFVYRIRDFVNSVYVVNPHKMKLISLVKKKTDKVDAEKLAMYLKMQILSGEDLIKPVHVPDRTIKELRSLFVSYKILAKMIVQLKNSIHSIYKQNLINVSKRKLKSKIQREIYLKKFSLPDSFQVQIKILLNQLESTEDNLKKIEDQIKLHGAPYYKEIDILTSMKGISVIMDLALVADISTISRFQNSKHLTSYLRSAPSVDSSNEKTIIGKENFFR